MRTIHDTKTQAYMLRDAVFEYQHPQIQRTDGLEWQKVGTEWQPMGHDIDLPAVVRRKAD